MHVGHIRSTILGDCLARTLRLLGHRVITDNHIGDWGTQFGKLLVGWKHHLKPAALKTDPIAEMERLYKMVNAASEADEKILEAARQELVKLQGGDAENLRIWREMIALSQKQFDTIYGRLGVKFDHTLGESFYNPRLKPLVDELVAKGIARESEGAIAIFFDDPPADSRNSLRSSAKATAGSITRPRTWPRWRIVLRPGSRTKSFTSPTAGSSCISSRFLPRFANGSPFFGGRVTRVPNLPAKKVGLAELALRKM